MITIPLPLYNQGDPTWAFKKLGNAVDANGNPLLMWSHGCYVTSVAMLLANFGVNVTPGELCDKLNSVNGFDAGGQLEWDAIEKLFPSVVWADSFWTTRFTKANDVSKVQQDVALNRIASMVRMGMPVILCVDVPHVNTPDWPDHAIVLKYAPGDGYGWTYNDPNGGTVGQFAEGSEYGLPKDGVFGARFLIGSPLYFADYSKDQDKKNGQVANRLAQIKRGRNVTLNCNEALDIMID